jgi:hypothetical protein
LIQEPGNRNFQILDARTGAQRPLLDDPTVGWIFSPRFSPDGRRVAASWTNQIQGSGLWILPLDAPRDATMTATASPTHRGPVVQTLDAASVRGRIVTLFAKVRTDVEKNRGAAYCVVRVEQPEARAVEAGSDTPIDSQAWNDVEVQGLVDPKADAVRVGCFLRGAGWMWIDDVRVRVGMSRSHWQPLPIGNQGFEENAGVPDRWDRRGAGYTYEVTDAKVAEGRRALVIASTSVSGNFTPIGWSPDGRYVYAVDMASSGPSLTVAMISADGRELRPLTQLPVGDGFALGSIAMSADARRIAYSSTATLSDVWVVDDFGGRAP